MLRYGQNSMGINQRHTRSFAKPANWTFIDIMKHGCGFTAALVIECIKDLELKGRMVGDTRVWTPDEAKKIIELATSTLDGTRYA